MSTREREKRPASPKEAAEKRARAKKTQGAAREPAESAPDAQAPSTGAAKKSRTGSKIAASPAVSDTPALPAPERARKAASKRAARPREGSVRAEAASAPSAAPIEPKPKKKRVAASEPQRAEAAPSAAVASTTARRARKLPRTPLLEDGLASEPTPEPTPPAVSPAEGASEDEIWSNALSGHAAPLETAQVAAQTPVESLEPAARLLRSSRDDQGRQAAAFGSSQSLLATDYYFRQYGAHGMRSLATEVDDFGFDPHVDEKLRPLLETLCKRYFRVDVVGAEHIQDDGRALLVANRSGALPWDGLVLRTALRTSRPELSPLRWLSEDSVFHYPFMGVLLNRLGAVRACPENAERLLQQDPLVAVFPEGAQGSSKLYRDRYRLQRFGRGGYIKLALKLGIPLLPTAIIGAEETNPVLRRSRVLGRLLGAESLPITPTFPWLGLAGLFPAPVRWRIVIGEPVDLSRYGAGAADDALLVHRLNEQIRSSLQALVDQGRSQRGHVLFG